MNAADQMVAYRALRRGLMNYELRQYYRGPEAFVDLPADAALIDARVADCDRVIVGGGSRDRKLLVPPASLPALPGAELVEDLANLTM